MINKWVALVAAVMLVVAVGYGVDTWISWPGDDLAITHYSQDNSGSGSIQIINKYKVEKDEGQGQETFYIYEVEGFWHNVKTTIRYEFVQRGDQWYGSHEDM